MRASRIVARSVVCQSGARRVDGDLGDDHVDHAVEEVVLARGCGCTATSPRPRAPGRAGACSRRRCPRDRRGRRRPRGPAPGSAAPAAPRLSSVVSMLSKVRLLTSLRRMDYLTPYGPGLTAYGRPERTTREGESDDHEPERPSRIPPTADEDARSRSCHRAGSSARPGSPIGRYTAARAAGGAFGRRSPASGGRCA